MIDSISSFNLNFKNSSNTRSMRGRILRVSAIILALVALIAGARVYFQSKAQNEIVTPTLKEVSLLPVTTFAERASALEITGTIRSKHEADIRFEVPGRITGVYATVGDRVFAGALIAEVENSAQRAAVVQARGALEGAQAQSDAAQASLAKVQSGTRGEQLAILQTNLESTESSANTAAQAARNALLGAYAAAAQSIIYGTDALFNTEAAHDPKLIFTVKDTSLPNAVNNKRLVLEAVLSRQDEVRPDTLTHNALTTELSTTLNELEDINTFLGLLLSAIDKGILDTATQTTYSNTASTARTNIINQISTVTTAHNALIQAQKQVTVAESNLEQGTTGAQQEDIDTAAAQARAAAANVTSAQGAYQAAIASLEKTRIRASITGTLASFSAKVGDFVSTQALGRIVGTGGSEVVFYVTNTDSARIQEGGAVLVNDTLLGIITSVSSDAGGLSGQLEVRADITEDTRRLTNNSSVSVHVLPSEETRDTDRPQELSISLNAVKFTASDTFVFTVSDPDAATSTLVALPITLGTVVGDMVAITGIPAEKLIVTDARGLRAGQTVMLK